MKNLFLFILVPLAFSLGCVNNVAPPNPYEDASNLDRQTFKVVHFPFARGTSFKISGGAFRDRLRQYSWDFEVNPGTSVLSIERGVVVAIGSPLSIPTCQHGKQPKARYVRVQQWDNTLAQYDGVIPRVRVGAKVNRGQAIATSNCVNFTVYATEMKRKASKRSPASWVYRNIPLYFLGVPNGIAEEEYEGVVQR
jgi:hypothetical protein